MDLGLPVRSKEPSKYPPRGGGGVLDLGLLSKSKERSNGGSRTLDFSNARIHVLRGGGRKWRSYFAIGWLVARLVGCRHRVGHAVGGLVCVRDNFSRDHAWSCASFTTQFYRRAAFKGSYHGPLSRVPCSSDDLKTAQYDAPEPWRIYLYDVHAHDRVRAAAKQPITHATKRRNTGCFEVTPQSAGKGPWYVGLNQPLRRARAL